MNKKKYKVITIPRFHKVVNPYIEHYIANMGEYSGEHEEDIKKANRVDLHWFEDDIGRRNVTKVFLVMGLLIYFGVKGGERFIFIHNSRPRYNNCWSKLFFPIILVFFSDKVFFLDDKIKEIFFKRKRFLFNVLRKKLFVAEHPLQYKEKKVKMMGVYKDCICIFGQISPYKKMAQYLHDLLEGTSWKILIVGLVSDESVASICDSYKDRVCLINRVVSDTELGGFIRSSGVVFIAHRNYTTTGQIAFAVNYANTIVYTKYVLFDRAKYISAFPDINFIEYDEFLSSHGKSLLIN